MQDSQSSSTSRVPTIQSAAPWDWDAMLSGESRSALEAALAEGLARRRWFGSKARSVAGLAIIEAIRWNDRVRLALVEVRFDIGPAEIYQLPLAFVAGERAERMEAEGAVWALVRLADARQPAAVVEAHHEPEFCADLLKLIDAAGTRPGESGELAVWQARDFARVRGDERAALAARVSPAEQSNSSVIFGDRVILKLFRRVETGLNPDLELNAHLSERGFAHAPPLAAAIHYRRTGQEPWALAMLQGYVVNRGDAWQYTLDGLEKLFAQATGEPPAAPGANIAGLLAAGEHEIPRATRTALRSFLADAERLGERTAEMHLALAAAVNEPAFAPQPLNPAAQQAFCDRAGAMVGETFDALRRKAPQLSGPLADRARRVLARQPDLMVRIEQFGREQVEVQRIRCHGDYHLGQVLVTGDDFMIIDFEGEPARPLAERREKQLALRDVAGMIRSFHYASRAAAVKATAGQSPEEARRIDAWAATWFFWISACFLAAYRRKVAAASFVPQADQDFERILEACVLEKAVYELRYELNNRPDWLYLPLAALAELLD